MFPSYGSLPRPSPSLLPGSVGTRSPAFHRYYGTAKTTGLLGRCSVCHVASPYLGLISFFRSPGRGNRRPDTRVLLTGVTLCLPVCFTRGHLRFSQVPCEPLVHLPCSQTPVGPPRQAMAAFRCCPRQQDGKDSSHTVLSRLYHTAFALAVYASCRPFERRRKTRFRWVANPCRMGFLMPIEFVRRVSAWRFPSPRAYLGATYSYSCSYSQSHRHQNVRARITNKSRSRSRIWQCV